MNELAAQGSQQLELRRCLYAFGHHLQTQTVRFSVTSSASIVRLSSVTSVTVKITALILPPDPISGVAEATRSTTRVPGFRISFWPLASSIRIVAFVTGSIDQILALDFEVLLEGAIDKVARP